MTQQQENQRQTDELKQRVKDFARELNQVLRAREDNLPVSPWGDPRAVVAHLRQGLSGQDAGLGKMLPYLAPFLAPDDAPLWIKEKDQWFFVVASLAASHGRPSAPVAENKRRPNLGESARELRAVSASCEARFANLLACTQSEVARRLREVVAIVEARDLSVNWGQLIYDLAVIGWHAPARPVQNSWARGFYSRANPNAKTADNSA